MPKQNEENKVRSFEIDEIDLADEVVVVVVRKKFTRALSLGLIRECENPALKALGHQIGNAGQILDGAPASDFPALTDLVTNEEPAEVEETDEVAV